MSTEQTFDASRSTDIEADLDTVPAFVRALERALESLAGDMPLDHLVVRVLDLVVQHFGAEDATLIFPRQNQWFVYARQTGAKSASVVPAQAIDTCDFVSHGIIQEVVRTRTAVVLDDALTTGPFVQDSHVLQSRVKSVLCMPLLRRASTEHISALIYLENKTGGGVFSSRRVETLAPLFMMVAVSLDNAIRQQEVDAKLQEMQSRLEVQEREFRAQGDKFEATRERLKQLQAQILAQEKMATLGAITAGIAHEIKNPLNFVINFAALSVELVHEIREEISHCRANMSKASRDNLDELLRTLADNCGKVNQHGLRADAIVRAMQLHARGQAGQPELTDINRLLDENMSLAYHGARSSDREFNATFEINFEPNLPKIFVVPQEIGRVFLNLFSNGFYAARAAAHSGRNPTLRVSTHDQGETIQIRVADNGAGIPEDVRGHIFEPFFTTKPIGQGTGLGLSLSYDIIVRDHGGMMRFESVTGEGTEFIIDLPKTKSET